MKTAAVLLSLLVIFLNAVPCCWDVCDEEHPVEERAGGDQACSPFLSCGSCTGFVLQQYSPEIPDFSSVFRPVDEQVEVIFKADHASDIWQPPKKV